MDGLLTTAYAKEDCNISPGDLFTALGNLGYWEPDSKHKSAKEKLFIWDTYSREGSTDSLKSIKRVIKKPAHLPEGKLEDSLI